MHQYRIFIIAFFISVLAMVVLFYTYLSGLLSGFKVILSLGREEQFPLYFLETIFSPLLITSLIITAIAGLLYRILGILLVAGNKGIEGGEQVIWIIGFVMFGFITAIVFMAMASSRHWGNSKKVMMENEPKLINQG